VRKYIKIEPGIRCGNLYIVRTRIIVYDMQGWMTADMTIEEIYN
jgi:uncharacterized protein (DUF433 family)